MPLLDREYAYVKRYREIVDVLIRYGLGYFVDRFGLRPFRSLRDRIIGSPRPFKEQMILRSEAERMRLALEELGPTFIKFGQVLGSRRDLIPEEYALELSKLHDRVPPFDYSDVAASVEKEFGRKIDELFVSFDPEPIAAASIGQVHRARLSGDQEIVVKVMRPEVEKIIETDLGILMNLARFAEKHIKESRFYNPVGFVDEFSRVMRQEIDYTNEAQNADRFFLNFEGSTTVKIPKVYWSYTTKRVLTLEYVEGIKVSDIPKLDEAGLHKKKISTDIAHAYLKMIFEDGFYHADPHPGNILISRDGVIIFLDFGIAGYIDPILKENLANLMIAIRNNDIDLFIEALTEMGFIVDVGAQRQLLRVRLEELISRYYSLKTRFLDPTAFLRDMIDVVIKNKGKIPSNIMLLSKTLIIRDEINRELDPEHNFAELVEPYVNKMIAERTSVSFMVEEAWKTMWDFTRMFKAFPRRLNHILSKAEKGTLRFELEHQGLETVIEELDTISNRLSFSIIIGALIVGSSLIILTRLTPSLWGVPLLGILGFFIAGFLGLGLLISIIRSGRW